MAHAQKPVFLFRRNGRVHLNLLGSQFSRILAAEVCASAVVMLDTPCSEAVWRVLATHVIRQFHLHFPSRAPPCAITFQLDSTTPSLHMKAYVWTGCTGTLILGRMVCSTSQPWKGSSTVRFFDFGWWKTTKLTDGPSGCGEMAGGGGVHLLGTSVWQGHLCLLRRTDNARPNMKLSVHDWPAPNIAFGNSGGQSHVLQYTLSLGELGRPLSLSGRFGGKTLVVPSEMWLQSSLFIQKMDKVHTFNTP
jgi:hypothetical protein